MSFHWVSYIGGPEGGGGGGGGVGNVSYYKIRVLSCHSLVVKTKPVWMRCPHYLGNSILSHPFHNCKSVVGCHVAPSTEVEPKGPIGRQVWPTNQLWKEDLN